MENKDIKKSDIDGERIMSVSDVGKDLKKHLTMEQQAFAEFYAVTNDKIKAYLRCGIDVSEMSKEQVSLASNIMISDKYVNAYIQKLREFALADGLKTTYANAVNVLSEIANGTIRDANGDLDFPKVSARLNASKELIRIFPDSLDRKKLEVDTELQESNVALQKEKLKVIQSGGMSAGENVMLEALKELEKLGVDPIE